THLAEPLDVPLPLLRRFAGANLGALYGAGASLLLAVESAGGIDPIADGDVRICDLSDDPAVPGAWAHEPQPADTHVSIDPVLGRVAFPAAPGAGETRLATDHYGSALETGGGGDARAASLEAATATVTVEGGDPLGPPLASVAGGGEVEILDSRPYGAPPSISATGAATVVLESANRQRPLLSRG